MVHAKNYETASAFVRVIQRKLLASFFRTRCILHTTAIISYIFIIIFIGDA